MAFPMRGGKLKAQQRKKQNKLMQSRRIKHYTIVPTLASMYVVFRNGDIINYIAAV